MTQASTPSTLCDHTVATLEKPAMTPSKKKIKVPDACPGVGVKCMTPYALMRLEGVRLVLGGQLG